MRTIKLVFASLFLVLSISSKAMTIYKCHQPFNVNDPNFQQGDELYLDIALEGLGEKTGLRMDFGRSFGPTMVAMKSEETDRFSFGADVSTFTAFWKNKYLSMVYIGNFTWGAYIKVGENEFDLPREIEMICKEEVDILDLSSVF